MSIRPLDLQVNINSMMEISKHQGVKESLAVEQQRSIDQQSIDDAKHRDKMVNASSRPDTSEELKDREGHHGSKTEPELENEYYEENQKEHPSAKKKDETPEDKKEIQGDSDQHHIDILA